MDFVPYLKWKSKYASKSTPRAHCRSADVYRKQILERQEASRKLWYRIIGPGPYNDSNIDKHDSKSKEDECNMGIRRSAGLHKDITDARRVSPK